MVLMTKIWKKSTAEKYFIFFQTSKLEFSSLMWVILALLDPEPAQYSQCGSGSATLVFGFSCHPFPRSAYFQQLRILIRNIELTFLCSSTVFSVPWEWVWRAIFKSTWRLLKEKKTYSWFISYMVISHGCCFIVLWTIVFHLCPIILTLFMLQFLDGFQKPYLGSPN